LVHIRKREKKTIRLKYDTMSPPPISSFPVY
jgi:hypothetical protein